MPSFKINHVISVWISNLYISLFYTYKMFMKSVNSVNSGHPSYRVYSQSDGDEPLITNSSYLNTFTSE